MLYSEFEFDFYVLHEPLAFEIIEKLYERRSTFTFSIVIAERNENPFDGFESGFT